MDIGNKTVGTTAVKLFATQPAITIGLRLHCPSTNAGNVYIAVVPKGTNNTDLQAAVLADGSNGNINPLPKGDAGTITEYTVPAEAFSSGDTVCLVSDAAGQVVYWSAV